MSKVSIVIADSQYLIRVGLRHILRDKAECEIIHEATDESQLLNQLKKVEPDVVVLDYNQPGSFTPETVNRLKKEHPNVRLLVISGDENKKTIYHVLENGVNSFLSKKCDEKEIIDAVYATSNNEKYYCTNVLNYLLEKSFPKENCAPVPLTPREIEIVRLVANGMIAKEIASELNLSTHTVYTHRKNIMKKLKFGTTSELVLYAVNEGIIQSV
ncbi:MAG: response regulator transcription factor [Bacteroidota bacterium]